MKASPLKVVSLTSLAFLSAAMLTSCAAIAEPFTNAYAVTYRVELAGDSTGTLKSFEYWGKDDRSTPADTVKSAQEGTADPQNAATDDVWSVETAVNVTDTARVSVTPEAGATATCIILLDGETEIARETGAPGAKVTCEAVVPEFPKDK